MKELLGLPTAKAISRTEKVNRLRLLTRLYVYEFARMEDVFNIFVSSLSLLGHIRKSDKKEFRRLFYDQFRPMIVGRNSLIHSITELPMDELFLNVLSSGEMFRRKRASSRGELREFDRMYVKLIRKRAFAMRLAGRRLSSLIQIALKFSPVVLSIAPLNA